ncbi:MAG: hypothetical protein N4A74_03775 [Carboxylicivirga sp.]|nr:hypothetical protein [Carboxylicivirga sp.]
MVVICGAVWGQIATYESYRPLTLDWEITRNGEHLEIKEPEDGNKVWARFNDDQSLQLIGTPNLLVPGKINVNNATDTRSRVNIKLDGYRWEEILFARVGASDYVVNIGNGGGDAGSSWFASYGGRTKDNAPGVALVGKNYYGQKTDHGIVYIDGHCNDQAAPDDQKVLEVRSTWSNSLAHITGDGSLFVKGNIETKATIKATEIKVEAQTADFVFEDNYQLKDLSEVEAFIKTNKHLPDIPSAAEMEETGVNLAEMNKLLLMKVEELTLYAIEQKSEAERLKAEVSEVRSSESEVRRELEEERDERRAMRSEMEKMKEGMEERLAKLEALLTK